MKIVFLMKTSYPEFLGGKEHFVHYIASEFSKDNNIVVISGGKKPAKKLQYNGYSLMRLPMLSFKFPVKHSYIFRVIFGVYAMLVKEKPDVLHVFDYGSNVLFVALLYARIKKIPIIASIDRHNFNNVYLKMLERVYSFCLNKTIYKGADMLFFNSKDHAYDFFKKFNVATLRKKTAIHQSCIRTNEYMNIKRDKELYQFYNLEGKIVLITVKRLFPEDNLNRVLFALHKIKNCKNIKNLAWIVIGPDCGGRNSFVTMVKKLGMEAEVEAIGLKPYHKIKTFLSISDIFIWPSLSEGIPLALLEAMSAGRAIICTKQLNIKNIIEDGKNGILVDFRDVSVLADSITKIVKEKLFRNVLGKNAVKKALEYDSYNEADKIRKLYNKTISEYCKY